MASSGAPLLSPDPTRVPEAPTQVDLCTPEGGEARVPAEGGDDACVPAPPPSRADMSSLMGMPRGTAAWVLRKGKYYPVVTGGYRQAPLPAKTGMVRVRYLSVKDQHRTVEDFPPASLRAWDDATARAAAARQQPSVNFSADLIAVVQRVADGEDADTVLRSTLEGANGVPTSGVATREEAPAESAATGLPAATMAPVPAAGASSKALKRPREEADSENAHPNPASPNPAEAAAGASAGASSGGASAVASGGSSGSGDPVRATAVTPSQSRPAAGACCDVHSVPRCNHRHALVRSRSTVRG